MMKIFCRVIFSCCILLAFCSQTSAARAGSAGLKIIYTANTFGTIRPCPT